MTELAPLHAEPTGINHTDIQPSATVQSRAELPQAPGKKALAVLAKSSVHSIAQRADGPATVTYLTKDGPVFKNAISTALGASGAKIKDMRMGKKDFCFVAITTPNALQLTQAIEALSASTKR